MLPTGLIEKNLAIFFLLVAIWLSILTYFLYNILSHYNRLVKDKKTGDLKSVLEELLKETKTTRENLEKIKKELEKIETDNLFHVQKTSLIRFNPFDDVGGDQSFVISLLDGRDNGLVISSLHSRAGTRVYAKPIEQGKPKGLELSKEEELAIKKAQGRSRIES
jgi:hypothetical protein